MSLNHNQMLLLTQQLMERLKRIVKLPHRLRPVQSSKVSGNCLHTEPKDGLTLCIKRNKTNIMKRNGNSS